MWILSFGAGGWGDELLLGAAATIGLAAAAMPLGLLAGLLLGLARSSPEPALRMAANLLSSIFRGLPELLTIFLVYTLGQRALNGLALQLGLGAAAEISLYWAGVAALAMVFAAYASEVFLGSIMAMKDTLLQAAGALALGPVVTLRFVILPEVFRLSAPGLSNLWLSLLKQTSLVSVIGYQELLNSGSRAAASTGEHIFFHAVVFVIYFALCAVGAPVFDRLIGLFSARHGAPQ